MVGATLANLLCWHASITLACLFFKASVLITRKMVPITGRAGSFFEFF